MRTGAPEGAAIAYGLPRWDDPGYWARFLDDLRPRFVVVRIRSGRLGLRWGVPLWAVEESLRFVLLALPWLAYAWRAAPERWRREPSRPGRRHRVVPPARAPWGALHALLEGHGRGVLRMDPGVPFVHVEAKGGAERIVVEVTQI